MSGIFVSKKRVQNSEWLRQSELKKEASSRGNEFECCANEREKSAVKTETSGQEKKSEEKKRKARKRKGK